MPTDQEPITGDCEHEGGKTTVTHDQRTVTFCYKCDQILADGPAIEQRPNIFIHLHAN